MEACREMRFKQPSASNQRGTPTYRRLLSVLLNLVNATSPIRFEGRPIAPVRDHHDVYREHEGLRIPLAVWMPGDGKQ
jgi:hypothetical protein